MKKLKRKKKIYVLGHKTVSKQQLIQIKSAFFSEKLKRKKVKIMKDVLGHKSRN